MESLHLNRYKKKPRLTGRRLIWCCNVYKEKKYKKIPQDLKVWFGDDFLARSYNNVYTISPIKFSGGMSSTITSMRNEGEDIDEIIKADIEIWKKKYLKNFF